MRHDAKQAVTIWRLTDGQKHGVAAELVFPSWLRRGVKESIVMDPVFWTSG
jgi:hypothetical protein